MPHSQVRNPALGTKYVFDSHFNAVYLDVQNLSACYAEPVFKHDLKSCTEVGPLISVELIDSLSTRSGPINYFFDSLTSNHRQISLKADPPPDTLENPSLDERERRRVTVSIMLI